MTGMLVTIRGTTDLSGAIHHDFAVQSLAGNLPEQLYATLPETPDAPPFDCLEQMTSDPNGNSTCLIDAGSALLSRLRQHGNGQQALEATLHALPGSAGREIRLEISLLLFGPHNLPWEALWDEANGFLELACHVPVLRQVQRHKGATLPSGQLGPDGLCVVAVLAAAGVEGLGEYHALRAALNAYGKPWTLHVFSPDTSVANAVTVEANADIRFYHMPTSTNDLMHAIASKAPQIVHFFCHGLAPTGGAPMLEVATLLTGASGPAVGLSANDLGAHLPATAWLVLLNACGTGGAGEGSQSIAAELVQAGVPFVIGMREPAQTWVLNAFTRGFLSEALWQIGQALDSNAACDLSLGHSLYAGRDAICQRRRATGIDVTPQLKEWAQPMLFTMPTPFTLKPGKAGSALVLAEKQSMRQVLVAYLALQAASLTPAALNATLQHIAKLDAEIGDLS